MIVLSWATLLFLQSVGHSARSWSFLQKLSRFCKVLVVLQYFSGRFQRSTPPRFMSIRHKLYEPASILIFRALRNITYTTSYCTLTRRSATHLQPAQAEPDPFVQYDS